MTKGPYTNRRLARSTDWSDTTLAQAEIVYDKTKMSVRVGDGSTVAGRALNFDNRTEILQPNQISANTDNYAPTGLKDAGIILMSADADRDLTGIDISVFPDGIEDRYISIAVSSSSPGSITIKDQSTNSSASNRFQIGRDLKMTPGSIQLFRYIDGSVNRWAWFGVPATALTFNPTESLQTTDVQSALVALQRRLIHVTSVNLNTPPATPAMGDTYIVGTSPTGAWSAQAKAVAVCSNATGPVWAFITPTNDTTIVYNRADGAIYRYTSSAWTATGSGINDTSILAVKLDTSTVAKQKDFRAAIDAAPIESLADHNMFANPGFEGGNEGSAAAITLTATSTLQTAQIVDDAQCWYRGSFVASMQQVTSPFVGGRYAIKTTVSLGETSLGASDELSIVMPIPGTRSARLAMGTAGAAPLAVGFWFQAHRTGTYSGSIRNGGKTRSYPFSFTVAAADTPQWVSLSGSLAIPGDTTGTWAIDTTVGLYVTIALGAGTARAGTNVTWAASDYSGATGTTNGVAATSDVAYISNVVVVPGNELPDATRAAYGGRVYASHVRANGVQSLSTAQQSQARANIGAPGLTSSNTLSGFQTITGGLKAQGNGATAGASIFLNNNGTGGTQWAVDSTDAGFTEGAGKLNFRKVGSVGFMQLDGTQMLLGGAVKITGSGTSVGASLFLNNNGTSGTQWAVDSSDSGYSEGSGFFLIRKVGSFSSLVINGSGFMRLPFYGAGNLVADGSGNITSSSDENLKVIHGPFSKGLASINALSPITYSWNEKSGMETEGNYAGFSAQNVQANIPEAVGQNRNGTLSLQDRPILAALVNAVKEIAADVAALKAAT